ncbi:Tn916 family transposase [Sporomusa ovata DSM 2662]|uniref:Integrase n=1 Tax=Sporomusa ovata TaxID=2378 RepID=A0A0U1L199_9FIRM|nr:site-specific integrase [Sporomusa ovata]EQB27589.1 DNA integration/recombination/inversion protein [Sporomusa ovata DSM 2662]CQR73442.1 Integrase [Sporomusa ovata]
MGRAKGDGTISWDEQRNCWFVRVTYKDPKTGETKRKKLKGSKDNTPKGKSVTLRIGQNWLEQIQTGMLPDADKMTLGDWIDTWLKEYIKPNVRIKSYDKYEGCLVQYVKPKLGNIVLGKIREVHLTALFNELLTSGGKKQIGLSSSTVRATRRYLSMCLEQAIKSDLLQKNPVKQTKPIKLVKAEIQTLTEGQADSLTAAAFAAVQKADQDYALRAAKAAEKAAQTGKYTQVSMANIVHYSAYMAILLGLGTGMRLGEIFGLSWDAVDVEKGIVYVKRALVTSRPGVNFEEPKTKASRRQIPLSSDIASELRKYKALQEWRKNLLGDQWSELNLVITNEFGGVFNTSNFTSRYFKPLLLQISAPKGFKFHDLRHTHATLLLLKGIPVKVVSERLGHSTVAMTQDTYAHVLPEMQEEAVKVLEGMFTKELKK